MEHSPTFGFSGAGRWVKCNGSINLFQDLPVEEDTPDSMEGVAAHWVCEQTLAMFKLTETDTARKCLTSLLGAQAPNGIIITEEMVDCARLYVTPIMNVVGEDPERRNNLFIELRVDARSMDPEAWGTVDAVFYDAGANTLYLWDYKFGHGSVLAYENWQMIGYAKATCDTFNYTRINPRLNINIVQPRCYDGMGAVRTWETTLDNLRGYINQMDFQIKTYRMNKTTLDSGPHCKDCRARHVCPSSRSAAANGIDMSSTTMPTELTADALAYEKYVTDIALDRLKQRSIALNAQVESRIRAGELIPGYNVESVLSKTKWNCPSAQVIMIGEMLKVDLAKDQDVITPTQAIAKLKKIGVDESAIAPYHERSSAGVKIVESNTSKAQEFFKSQ